jgi:hypothetical protein
MDFLKLQQVISGRDVGALSRFPEKQECSEKSVVIPGFSESIPVLEHFNLNKDMCSGNFPDATGQVVFLQELVKA